MARRRIQRTATDPRVISENFGIIDLHLKDDGSHIDAVGTVEGQTLYWDNTNGKWKVSSTLIQNVSTGVITFNGAYTFPTADGTANYALITNGSGALSFGKPLPAQHAIDSLTYHLGATGTAGDFFKLDANGLPATAGFYVEAGNSAGQLLFWDGADWRKAETIEMVWDDTNKRLGIGTATPAAKLQIDGDAMTNDQTLFGIAEAGTLRFGIRGDFNTPGRPVYLESDAKDKAGGDPLMTISTTYGMIAIGSTSLKGLLTLADSATLPPLNVTERSAAPSGPVANDIYLDDGTNTASGNPGWRRYTGAAWEDIHVASAATVGARDLTGFENRTDSTISMSGSDFQIQPAVTSWNVWNNGVKTVHNALESVAITNDLTLHFVYYSAGVLTVSTALWDISGTDALVAIVYKDGATYAITDERHGHNRDRHWHEWAHLTIGARYYSGLTGTFGNSSLSVTQGIIYDEDIDHDTGGTETTCSLWYRNVGATSMRLVRGSSVPYATDGGVLAYDNAGTLTPAGSNKYVMSFVYASGDPTEPIYVVPGQAQYNTAAQAESAPLPTLLLSTAEWKLIYKVLYRNVGGTATYIEAIDQRQVSTGPAGTAVPASHTALIDRDAANSHPVEAITGIPEFVWALNA